MDVQLREQPHFERAFSQALILMTRSCLLSRSNSSARPCVLLTSARLNSVHFAIKKRSQLKRINSLPWPITA